MCLSGAMTFDLLFLTKIVLFILILLSNRAGYLDHQNKIKMCGFKEGYTLKKNQLDNIVNGRLKAIIDLICVIPEEKTWLTTRQLPYNKMWKMYPHQFQPDQIQNGRLSAIICFNMPDIWHEISIIK